MAGYRSRAVHALELVLVLLVPVVALAVLARRLGLSYPILLVLGGLLLGLAPGLPVAELGTGRGLGLRPRREA
jgi:CPA1 family monovalent cation:H+ antiporter